MRISTEKTNSKRIRDLEGGTVYTYQGDTYLKIGRSTKPCYAEYRTHPTASILISKNNTLDTKRNVIKQFNVVYWNEEARNIEVCYDKVIGKMEIEL